MARRSRLHACARPSSSARCRATGRQLGLPSGVDPDRHLLVISILQVLLRAPAMRDRPRLRFTWPTRLLALATAMCLASAFFAGTLYSKGDLFQIIDTFGILPFLAFLTVPLVFRTRHHRRILLIALVSLGGYLGLTTLFEMIHLNALVFPRYILNPNYGIHYGHGRGPFVEADANGFACFVCAAACGIAVASWSGRWTRILAGAHRGAVPRRRVLVPRTRSLDWRRRSHCHHLDHDTATPTI